MAKRIIDLDEALIINDGDFLVRDNADGTKKVKYSTFLGAIMEGVNLSVNEHLKGTVNKTDIVDSLTSTDGTKVLSAKQGQILDTSKINVSDIVNSLVTGGTTKVLSAEQGKALKGLIDAIVIPDGVTVINDLVTGGTTKALSAEQGKVLKGLIDGKVFTVLDTLTSTSTTSALSANQGRALKALIDAIVIPPSTVVVDNVTSTSTTSALSANQGKVLKGLVDTANTNIGNITSGTTTVGKSGQIVETRASTATKIWVGTEAQYTAITTKDTSTLYFITV